MGSSTAGVTVTDDSAAAISDEDGATTDTDVDVKGDVDSSLPSDPSPFSQGEKVLAFFQNHVYPAKNSSFKELVEDPSLDPYVDFIDSLCLMQSEPFCLRFLLISRVVSSSEWGGIPLIPALDRLTLAIVTSRETGVCFLNQLLQHVKKPRCDGIVEKPTTGVIELRRQFPLLWGTWLLTVKAEQLWHLERIVEGWKKSWDEWVSMDRLMKFTEENVQKQVVLNKRKSTEKITKTGVARGKKRKIDSVEKVYSGLPVPELLSLRAFHC
ncbi:hypothetical protein C3L33_10894, partial [Rhododendron williamsianum]